MLVVFHEETINILNVCESRFRFEIKSDVKNKKKQKYVYYINTGKSRTWIITSLWFTLQRLQLV